MSAVNRKVSTEEEYRRLRDEASHVFDLAVRFPNRPHRRSPAHIAILDWDWFLGDDFPTALKALAKRDGTDMAVLVAVDPDDPGELHMEDDFPAAIIQPSAFSSEAYNQIILPKLTTLGFDGIYMRADVIAIYSRSFRWSIWAERTWEFAVICAEFDLHFLGSMDIPVAFDFRQAVNNLWPSVDFSKSREEQTENRQRHLSRFAQSYSEQVPQPVGVKAENVASIGALIHEFPELTEILQESLEDNEGQVLAHLIMADVFRWMAAHVENDRSACQSIVNWLEREFERGPDEVKNLIIVSGVELIPDPGDTGAELRDMLGPLLKSMDPWII
ncbi:MULTISPECIES: hypothetical protein [Arthrobacter]|uniref:DUF7674 domain-containing protein n=2 Tax=Arthrobacter TaxID=1663 RepID=A0ABU9KLV3_9MICC|nr:hypothetical protein [Arthrobacter sp. YJM1]MDP5228193.1 hypothetical protein [Arthrobacter sp. YJM1]